VRPEWVLLLLLYSGTAALAVWQASRHPTPTIFSDELEMTQLARSLADTGHATLRGMAPRGLVPLGAFVSAPFWLIDSVTEAYAVVKAVNALVMALVVFPAYGLARLVVSPRWALFAAAGTGLAPALAYAPILVKEPTAYPVSALAIFLITRWVARPGRWGFVLAVAVSVLGVLAKEQLQVLFPILAIGVLAVAWRMERLKAFRRTWSTWDWIGAVTLVAGLAVVANAFVSHRSNEWYVTTTFFQDRMRELLLWATGSLAIGLGIVPLIAGLASLVRPKNESPRPEVSAFTIVTVASILSFGGYTAIKAAYISTVFATLTVERNLIFLVPLLFTGTALFLERRRGRWWAVVAAGALALYLVHITPYSLTQYPNYEAHGLAIIALANRIFIWPASTIEHALIIVTVAATAALIAVPRLRPPRLAVAATVVIAGFTLAWTVTTEVYAANGESRFSHQLYSVLPKPPNWLDRMTQDRPTVFLGQAIRDPNPINLLEFWNRSITGVWSLDTTAPGPGTTITPDLVAPDGTLTPPHTDFVVTTPGVDVAGRRIGIPVGGYTLSALDGSLQLRTARTGVYPDGWMGGLATFAQYDVPPGQAGRLKVDLSRAGWCGPDVRSVVDIRVGTIEISPIDKQPAFRRVTGDANGVLHSCQTESFELTTPPKPWRAEVKIDPTFVPAKLDKSSGDARDLGAVVTFTYVPDR
jgi:uncharacterized membrane protein